MNIKCVINFNKFMLFLLFNTMEVKWHLKYIQKHDEWKIIYNCAKNVADLTVLGVGQN